MRRSDHGELPVAARPCRAGVPNAEPVAGAPAVPRSGAAPSPDDIGSVLSSAHHAVDAVARIAIEGREAARAAAADHRLYVPTRLAPEEWDIPYPYSPAPDSLADELLITYDTAIEAGKHAVAVLDDLAVAMGTPSHILGTAREASASQLSPPSPASGNPAEQGGDIQQPDTLPQPRPLGRVLHDLQISEPRTLLRAAAIDQAAHELTAAAQAQRRAAARDVPGRTVHGDCQQPSARRSRAMPIQGRPNVRSSQ